MRGRELPPIDVADIVRMEIRIENVLHNMYMMIRQCILICNG